MRRVLLLCLLIAAASGVSMAPAASWQNPGAPTEGRLVGFIPPPTPGGPSQFAMSSGAPAVFASGGPGSDPRRPCCGDAWDHIQTGPTTYNWSALDSWVNNALSHGVKPIYSFNEVSGYVNGGKPYSFPPTDVDSGNASATTFATKVMQRYCHTTTPPAAPGDCDIETFEGWNEFNTGSNLPCTSCGFWSGTYLQLAKMDMAFRAVVKLYCPTCKFYGGSTTAGGDGYNPGGGSSQFDVAMKQFLQAYISIGGPDFDGITFHPYCCRTNVFPEPFPSTIKSDSSPLCTGGVTSACRTPMMDQVALMRTALCDPSISSHYCGKPIGTTEGGFNHNNNLADSKNISLSGSGTTVTATSSTDLPADWTTGTRVRIDLANPTGFNTNADAYNTITVTGVRTFTYPSSMSGTSSSGLATTVTVSGGQVIWTDATWKIRQAWDMQWMMGLWQPGTEFDLLYVYDDRCWNTVKGSGAHAAQCPKDPIIPSGNTVLVDSWNRMIGWFDHSTPGAGRVAHAVGSDTVYTMAFTHNGLPAMFVWFSGWRRATNWPTPAGYNRLENADGVVSTPGATIPVENRPALLTSTATPPVTGPAWAPFLNASRAIDWSTAGFTIPNYTVACATTVSLTSGSGAASANRTSIQNALNSCDATHNVVNIPSGTYYVTSVSFGTQGNQVLRGAGPNSTTIIPTTGVGCGAGLSSGLCLKDSVGYYNGSSQVQPGGSNACNWTAGYAQGSTILTFASCGSAPPVGQTIILDQANDTSDTSGVYVCDVNISNCGYESNTGGNNNGRSISSKTHSQQQIAKVVSATSLGGGGYTVTISPGVYFTNIRSGQAPGAWWPGFVQHDGVENMTIDGNAISGGSNISLYDCYQCWVKNVRSENGGRNHVDLYQSADDVIRDSYFFAAQGSHSESYAVEFGESSSILVENNVFQQVTTPTMFGAGTGSVIGYNYAVDVIYDCGGGCSSFGNGSYASHNAGNNFNLFEGNNFYGIWGDDAWGSTSQDTYFRNMLAGWQNGKSNSTFPILMRSYIRDINIIGNVLGQPGYSTQYQAIATSTSSGTGAGSENTSIYSIGWAGTGATCSSGFVTQCDPLSGTTLMRWGNYDTVTAGVRWNSTESAAAANTYVNANYSTTYFNTLAQTLPASLYYTATPSWWTGGKNWPAVGPDVTTGNVGTCTGTYAGSQAISSGQCTSGTLSTAWGSHTTSTPAQDCYLNTMHGPPDGTGSVLSFDASTCY